MSVSKRLTEFAVQAGERLARLYEQWESDKSDPTNLTQHFASIAARLGVDLDGMTVAPFGIRYHVGAEQRHLVAKGTESAIYVMGMK